MAYKILVLDDEDDLCDILKFNLESEGYQVSTVNSAVEALEMDLSQFDLFIVDIMMDGLSGYDFVQRLRATSGVEDLPVIFCSALGDEDDKVTGLNIGGDDYITKPFIISEVKARVRAVLRRAGARKRAMEAAALASTQASAPRREHLQPPVTFQNVYINQNTKQCTIGDREVQLTRTEYDLLLFFLTHRGRIYSREEIIRNVWGDDVVVSQRAIDTNLTRLRKKIGDVGSHIVTRQGFGYGFEEGN